MSYGLEIYRGSGEIKLSSDFLTHKTLAKGTATFIENGFNYTPSKIVIPIAYEYATARLQVLLSTNALGEFGFAMRRVNNTVEIGLVTAGFTNVTNCTFSYRVVAL